MPSLLTPTLEVELLDPASLVAAPWNPNRVSPEDAAKLDASIARHGLFKPVIIRTLDDGTRQILGGHYRVESALRLGLDAIPVVNLGQLSDDKAKEITVIDNGRYGQDDTLVLGELLDSLGDSETLSYFLPFDKAELEAITTSCKIDLDTLGLEEPDAEPVERAAKAAKTHQVMRFKVSVEDEKQITETFKAIMQAQDFTGSDQLTNAGDALVWLVNAWAAGQDG